MHWQAHLHDVGRLTSCLRAVSEHCCKGHCYGKKITHPAQMCLGPHAEDVEHADNEACYPLHPICILDSDLDVKSKRFEQTSRLELCVTFMLETWLI